ncbi:ComEA family DNA-binding protein [Nocardia sp. NBC_01327]|uniref:ComEA family DNA-binding protein n=1 Tax=Nocardia sp. NBC_01327 TaxID=2903593 RepID=UPI002E111472|nr:ComEA family DNA-binding protein [Nocardia sp. NBC_01327]
MPRTDERTEVRRRLGGLSEPSGAAPEFSPDSAHPPRWDAESLDPPSPAPVSAGCRADGFEHDAADGDPEPPHESSTPAWLSEPCGSVSLWHERLVPERFRGTRWDPGPRGVLILAAVAALVVVLTALMSFQERPVTQAVPPIAVAGESAGAEPESGSGEGAANPAPGAGSKGAAPSSAAPSSAAPNGVVPSAAAPRSAVPYGAAPGSAAPAVPPNSPGAVSIPEASAGDRGPAGTVPTDINGHPASSGELVVSVVGLVEHGGLRRFPSGARIADAIRAAAPRPEADLSGLNLAQHLCDGDQLIIGRNGPRPGQQQVGSTVVNSAGPAPATVAASGSPRPSGPAPKVNLNTATETQLDTLPGVGPVTARAILTWRTTHGRFTSVDQLAEIEGIGPSRLARLRAAVTI